MEKMNNVNMFNWTLSYLSSVAGEFCTLADEGRLFSWGGRGGNYWLTLIKDDDGNPHVMICACADPSNLLFSVIGYCVYHDINYDIDDSLPDCVGQA
jgi:hypothetical protein